MWNALTVTFLVASACADSAPSQAASTTEILVTTTLPAPGGAETSAGGLHATLALWLGPPLLGIALFACALPACMLAIQRRSGSKAPAAAESSRAVTSAPEGVPRSAVQSSGPVAMAFVTQAFDPTQAAHAAPGRQHCISLSVGDVVEVHETHGSWLHGQIYDRPDKRGFFPEGHVAWIGRTLPRTLPGQVETDASSGTEQGDFACPMVMAKVETSLTGDVELGA